MTHTTGNITLQRLHWRAIINDIEVVISLCYVSSLKYTGKIFEQVQNKKIEGQKKEEDDDDDDIDLFGSDDEEEDDEAQKLREERLKQYADKKSKSQCSSGLG